LDELARATVVNNHQITAIVPQEQGLIILQHATATTPIELQIAGGHKTVVVVEVFSKI